MVSDCVIFPSRAGGAAFRPNGAEHDPGVAEVHLDARDRIAIAEVLLEAEGDLQPGDGGGEIGTGDVGEHGRGRDRTVVDHGVAAPSRESDRRSVTPS